MVHGSTKAKNKEDTGNKQSGEMGNFSYTTNTKPNNVLATQLPARAV